MHPRFSFRWLLDELKETMSRELDFEAEGMNSEKCKKDLEHLKFIYVPDVLWGLTSKRILTTEFIDGIKISEVEDLKKKGLNLNRIGEDLLYAFAEQVFHTGFVHADPHPGNILVRKNQYTKDAQLVLLDHGLYETLPTEIRQPLARVWQAVVENDSDAMKKYSSLLGINDYRLFCMTLTQRWVGAAPGDDDFLSKFFESRGGVKGFTRKDFKKLPEDEKVKFRAAFRDLHDKVFDVFQNIPPRLVLVFRNLNIIRSIIKDHQTGVDRHQIMARSAVRGFFFKEGDTIFNHTKGFLHLFMFDMRLLYDWTKIKFAKIGMKMLVMVGFIPSLEEMRESIPQDIENV
jgi:aarF domain-containing kinase